MSLLTGLALRRRSVTVLIIFLILAGGILTYRSLQVTLFPEIDFPLVTVMTFYPSANPDAVVSNVTRPIENAISVVGGLESVQSVSSENLSLVLINFVFGTDMAEAEGGVAGALAGLAFPEGVGRPRVARINPDQFPVMQLSALADMEIPELQRHVRALVLPAIQGVEGVLDVEVTGAADQRIVVALDPVRLSNTGISPFQVASALQDNNLTLPAGALTENGQTFPVRTTHTLRSVEELGELVVGVALVAEPPGPGARARGAPVTLAEVADIRLGAGAASSVSRTNGRPSIGIGVLKEPEANTVEVTTGVLDALAAIDGLPPGIEIATIFNDGPQIKAQIDSLQREAFFGFVFAVAVVFIFLLTLRPTIVKGLRLTLRPTLVIGLSIPLSIFAGILLMGWQGMSLNFMTLGGLAISVGRVVDDSIVVLENVYRHMRRDEDRFKVALEATREVAPAITASTLTTIVVFLPLAFIHGLVGSFFLPFALTVSFALIASLLVALTAVPVVGALLLRAGDFPDDPESADGERLRETWMHRAYTPVLRWALGHKAATLAAAAGVLAASLALMLVIPVTLFPGGGQRFLNINLTLPAGTSVDRTFEQVDEIEGVLAGLAERGQVDSYLTTVGNADTAFTPGAGPGLGASGRAAIFVGLTDDAPEDIATLLREELSAGGSRQVSVIEIGNGPPSAGLEVSVTGADYGAISEVARSLMAEFSDIDGVIDVSSDIAESRDEIVIDVDPALAATVGLSARSVALQVSQFMVGRKVTQIELADGPTDVVLVGRVDGVGGIDQIRDLAVAGPMGTARLGDIALVRIEDGPVTISRTDGRRSASITGAITVDDPQAIGRKVQKRIDAITIPSGVEVVSGGIFRDIEEGFQDIFLAMAIGVVLVYLVMAASLGTLRNPFVIIMSLPLAVIGALAALAVTGRALGLPALMGFLLLIGIVVTNAIVLVAFVEQLRERGAGIQEALVLAGRVRLRPILMTGFTTSFALVPLAVFVGDSGGIIGAELATVVIGGLVTSTFLTLIVVPVVYTLLHVSIPGLLARLRPGGAHRRSAPATSGAD